MEQEGITENFLRRNFPDAPESFIKRNIGNKDWVRTGMAGSPAMADAYEKLQRASIGEVVGVTEVKTLNGKTVQTMTHTVGEWCEIGGKRKYLRSHWEKNYAHYLEFLKVIGYIKDWNYETKTFWFEGIRRGVNNYKPDFFVILNDGQEEFREVKGYMDSKSKTKLKRMKKYFPLVKMRVIDGAWFKKNGKTMALLVPGWTKKKVAAKSVNP